MPKGFSQPTASSASRSEPSGPREQSQQTSVTRTRRGRYEVPAPKPTTGESKEPNSASSHSTSSKTPDTGPIQTPSAPPLSPIAPKSPSYLQGKNPYGRLLDSVEHPYRPTANPLEPANAVIPQSSSETKSRTPNPALPQVIKTAQSQSEPPTTASDIVSPPRHSRSLPKSGTVQSAKDFFEVKASQKHQIPDPLSSPAIPIPRRVLVNLSTISQSALRHVSSPRPMPPAVRALSGRALQPAQATSNSPTADDSDESKANGAEQHVPRIVVRKYTGFEGVVATGDSEVETTGRRRSTNIFDVASSEVIHGPIEGGHDIDTVLSSTGMSEYLQRSGDRVSSEETVRRPPKSQSTPNIAIEALPDHMSARTDWRSDSNPDVSKVPGGQPQGHRSLRLRRTRSISLTEESTPNNETVRASKRYSKPSTAEIGPKDSSFTNVRQKIDNFTARGLSHDGPSSLPSLSRRNSDSSSIPTASLGVQDQYHTIDVPDHIDWRGAYGRRKTQGFGFPGARVRPRATARARKSFQDPGNWVKRACGHFSSMAAGEARSQARRKDCRQCMRNPASLRPQIIRRHRLRRRIGTDSCVSTAAWSTESEDRVSYETRRRLYPSGCFPSNKCENIIAEDLGHVLESILEEHTRTLQGIINNINRSQPNLAHIRHVSDGLIQRCRSCGIRSDSGQNFQRPRCGGHRDIRSCPARSEEVCSTVCEDLGESIPQTRFVLPNEAEKLNMGSTGQVEPNVNDPWNILDGSIKTISDVLDLINSAADDLGVDLDRRPSVQDDEEFLNAPYQDSPRASTSSRERHPLEAGQAMCDFGEQSEGDYWQHLTRKHLIDLSAARAQLMEELGSIAEKLCAQLQTRGRTEPIADPVQRLYGRVAAQLAKCFPRDKEDTVDYRSKHASVAYKKARFIERLGRVLATACLQTKRMAEVSQGLRDIGRVASEETRGGDDVAKTELSAAIKNLINVLQTLPALEYFSGDGKNESVFGYSDPMLNGSMEIVSPNKSNPKGTKNVPPPTCDETNNLGRRLYAEPHARIEKRDSGIGRPQKDVVMCELAEDDFIATQKPEAPTEAACPESTVRRTEYQDGGEVMGKHTVKQARAVMSMPRMPRSDTSQSQSVEKHSAHHKNHKEKRQSISPFKNIRQQRGYESRRHSANPSSPSQLEADATKDVTTTQRPVKDRSSRRPDTSKSSVHIYIGCGLSVEGGLRRRFARQVVPHPQTADESVNKNGSLSRSRGSRCPSLLAGVEVAKSGRRSASPRRSPLAESRILSKKATQCSSEHAVNLDRYDLRMNSWTVPLLKITTTRRPSPSRVDIFHLVDRKINSIRTTLSQFCLASSTSGFTALPSGTGQREAKEVVEDAEEQTRQVHANARHTSPATVSRKTIQDKEHCSVDVPSVIDTTQNVKDEQEIALIAGVLDENTNQSCTTPAPYLLHDSKWQTPTLSLDHAEPLTTALKAPTTYFSSTPDTQLPTPSLVPSSTDGYRRASAAPGIMAPSTTIIQELFNSKPTATPKKPKKMVNYPPELQRPPAPPYPARETPVWTRPDTQTPPPKAKAATVVERRRFWGWGGGKRQGQCQVWCKVDGDVLSRVHGWSS